MEERFCWRGEVNKFVIGLILILLTSQVCFSQTNESKSITNLPAASSLIGNEIIPLVQGGATKRSTISAVKVFSSSDSCKPTGAAGLLYNNGSNACLTDTHITVSSGDLTTDGQIETTDTTSSSSSSTGSVIIGGGIGVAENANIGGTLTVTGLATFGAVKGKVTSQSGTGGSAYTFTSTDCGTLILATGSSAATYTVPNSLPEGCHIAVSQETSGGQVTISAGSGATFNANPHSYTKSFGQYAIIGISVKSNSNGTSAVFTLLGDGA